jgi:hypothetical protein
MPGCGGPCAFKAGTGLGGRGRAERRGFAGKSGRAWLWPLGARPLSARDPARRRKSASERRGRRRSGTLLFCRPGIVGSSGQPGHICRCRHCRAGLGPPKSRLGGGPGRAGRRARAGAGRAGHFLCPAALPRAPLPPRQSPLGTRPACLAHLLRPGRTFRVGRTKKKKFRRRGWPGRALGPARRRDTRTAAVVSLLLVLRGAGRTRAAGRSAFLSLPGVLPCVPGKLGRGARELGKPPPGLSPAGGPAAWPFPRSPRRALGLGGRGPGSSARSPRAARRHSRAHTPSRGLLSAGDAGRGHGVCVCTRVFVVIPPHPTPYFPGGDPSSNWLQGTPRLGFYRGEDFFSRYPRLLAPSWWKVLAMAYVVSPVSLDLPGVNRTFVPFLFKDWRSG